MTDLTPDDQRSVPGLRGVDLSGKSLADLGVTAKDLSGKSLADLGVTAKDLSDMVLPRANLRDADLRNA